MGGFWDSLLKGPRQKRSERREALGILLSCLVHRVDLATLRVGIPMKGGQFRAYTDQELARMTGLGIRRLERAMQDLVEIGFIRIQKRCQKREDGPYRGVAAIRTISLRFFELMGLGKRLRKQQALRRPRGLGFLSASLPFQIDSSFASPLMRSNRAILTLLRHRLCVIDGH